MSTFEDHSHGEVRAAELGDGVVAELQEDTLVQALGALGAGLAATRRRRHLPGELVQVQPPQRPAVARVAREQRSLHDLRQVHDAEDGPSRGS